MPDSGMGGTPHHVAPPVCVQYLARCDSSHLTFGGPSMKHLFAAIAALATLPLLAQTASAPAKPAEDPAKKPVAIVNGQTITAADLDMLYDRLGTKAREAYNQQGGKSAYLENYIRKRLVVQE